MSGKVVMGLDIGSTSSKCVLLQGDTILAASVIQAGAGTGGASRTVLEALEKAKLSEKDIACTVATGYGRNSIKDAAETKSELSCHAKGAEFLCPGVRTVIDIGGQDAKAISLDDKGRVQSFVMNDKCAAGTGRFLDVMARVLQLDVSELAAAGERSRRKLDISSTCTVFAESEVISHLAADAEIDDVVAGIHRSVASRVAGLVNRCGLQAPVVMTGGVAQNSGVVNALEQELKTPITVSPTPQIIGALGAALYARELLK